MSGGHSLSCFGQCQESLYALSSIHCKTTTNLGNYLNNTRPTTRKKSHTAAAHVKAVHVISYCTNNIIVCWMAKIDHACTWVSRSGSTSDIYQYCCPLSQQELYKK